MQGPFFLFIYIYIYAEKHYLHCTTNDILSCVSLIKVSVVDHFELKICSSLHSHCDEEVTEQPEEK